MDLITENLVLTFVKEHGWETLAPDRQFEHFASYITIRQLYKETFDTGDVVTGGGSDTGIDAIAVLVNGRLVTDVDELNDVTANGSANLDVAFVFVQAERTSGFDGAKITTFGQGVIDLFSSDPKLPRNAEIKDAAALVHAIYQRAPKFARGRPTCHLFYVTTGTWQGDQVLEARRQVVCADLMNFNLFEVVEFTPIDANKVRKLYTQATNTISRTFDFPKKHAAPAIGGVSQAFLGYIPAKAFRSIVTDDAGELLRTIFYDNVRDWEGDNDVNSAMADTLKSDFRDRFLLMNNGVTIIARSLQQVGDAVTIYDYQIVNGCQTSHVIYNNLGQEVLDEVMIPLRLIATDNEDVTASIIQATNRQTSISPAPVSSDHRLSKKLENFMSAYDGDRRLYYERRTRQYEALSIEKVRIISPDQLIRAFASMFLDEPHGTTRSFRRLRDRIGDEIFNPQHKLDPYYAAALTHYRLEYLFRNQKMDAAFKPARYHLMLAFRILAQASNVPKMNSNEMERYCAKLTKTLWDVDLANALFSQAAQIVHSVAEAMGAITTGALDRDVVRTQPFTASVMEQANKVLLTQEDAL